MATKTDSLLQAFYILQEHRKVVHSADAWQTLVDAESYIRTQYEIEMKRAQVRENQHDYL